MDIKAQYECEKIYEDEHIIQWRVSWVWFGKHFEEWITEHKEPPD